MMKEYFVNNVSLKVSRSNIPSVKYFIIVSFDVQSSKRIEYPTSCPKIHPNSSLTLLAIDIAATLLGCVHPTIPFSV